MQIPIDKEVNQLIELPFTISYVIRKRAQVDSLMELPREQRPTDELLWNGSADEIDAWLDKVMRGKNPGKQESTFIISEKDIE